MTETESHSEPKTFDIGSVPVSDVAELAIIHPATAKPTTWKLHLAGPGHPETIAISNEASRERMVREQAQERARVNGRKWKGEDIDPVAEREKTFRRAARRIVGWTPVTMNGETFPYSAENAFRLLNDPKFGWVAEQFYNYLGEDAAFIESSGKTS
jgi:hypothetical protein